MSVDRTVDLQLWMDHETVISRCVLDGDKHRSGWRGLGLSSCALSFCAMLLSSETRQDEKSEPCEGNRSNLYIDAWELLSRNFGRDRHMVWAKCAQEGGGGVLDYGGVERREMTGDSQHSALHNSDKYQPHARPVKHHRSIIEGTRRGEDGRAVWP